MFLPMPRLMFRLFYINIDQISRKSVGQVCQTDRTITFPFQYKEDNDSAKFQIVRQIQLVGPDRRVDRRD